VRAAVAAPERRVVEVVDKLKPALNAGRVIVDHAVIAFADIFTVDHGA